MSKKTNRYRSSQTWYAFQKAFCTGPKIIVGLDTETTGLNPEAVDGREDNIVQFSGIKYKYDGEGNFERIGDINLYIKNNVPIPEKVSKKTGIYDMYLVNKPAEDMAIIDVDSFLSDVDVIVAYNTPFDVAFIRAMYRRCNRPYRNRDTFDVLAMFRDLYSMYKCERVQLEKAYKYLKLDTEGEEVRFHNSFDDITATMKILFALFEQYKKLPEPVDSSNLRIPKIYNYWFWDNPQAHKMSRIYFSTDCGRIYYEKMDRSFGVDLKRSDYTLEDLNMEGFIRSVLRYLGVSRLEDLSHLKNPDEKAG